MWVVFTVTHPAALCWENITLTLKLSLWAPHMPHGGDMRRFTEDGAHSICQVYPYFMCWEKV